jgi:hypothetical protein
VGLRALLRRRRAAPPVAYDPDDPCLEVVVEAFEAARADSAVLAEAAQRGVDLARPLLVRHHLVALPGEQEVAEAGRLLAQDGYCLRERPGGGRPRAVLACRTQVLTPLSASQERSRMAGLAQRLGGDVEGYDALAPRADAAPAAR